MIAAAVSACGTTASPATKEATQNSSYAGFLTDSGAAVQATSAIDRAEVILVNNCLRGTGFRYYFDVPVAQLRGAGDAPNVVTSAMLDEAAQLEKAKADGYGLYAEWVQGKTAANSISGAPPEAVYASELPSTEVARYQRLVLGPERDMRHVRLADGDSFGYFVGGGCLGKARAALYGTVVRAVTITYVPEDFAVDVSSAVDTDPRYLAGLDTWTRCMHSATGQQFKSPDAVPDTLNTLYQQQGPTLGLRSEEIRLAVASLRCEFSTGLLRLRQRLFAAHAAQLPETEERLLITLQQAQQRALHKAAAIIATGS